MSEEKSVEDISTHAAHPAHPAQMQITNDSSSNRESYLPEDGESLRATGFAWGSTQPEGEGNAIVVSAQ